MVQRTQKTQQQKREERMAQNAIARGDYYAIVCSATKRNEPTYFSSMAAAEERLEAIVRTRKIQLPDDFHRRRAEPLWQEVHIEQFHNGAWVVVEGSVREFIYSLADE